jgi:WS/DGAT/MGAT family acyltransferase
MSHADAAWLRMDSPTNLMVINSVLFFATAPDWDRLRANHVQRIVERHPRFRCVARPGGPLSPARWEEDPTFDPADHFHRVAVPEPGDRAALQALIADLASAPLDHGRPLWEVHLIEGVGDGCALLTRVHHAVADGVTLARVLLGASDSGDPGPGIGGEAEHHSALGTLLGGSVAALTHPRATLERGYRDLGTLAKLIPPGSEHSQVLKGGGRPGHRVAWSDPLDLWRVKRVARVYRVTVNDVLMAALAGALRHHVAAAGGEPERLHALVPLNLRPLDEPVPDDLGNRFGLVLADLPLEVEDDIDRLWEVNRSMDAIKRSDEGAITYGILDVMGRTPTEVEARLLRYFSAKASMVVTNVRGPDARFSLGGAPCTGVLVWAPCAGDLRMTVSLFSYAGKVTAGFLTDASVIEDPQPLADAFRAELLALARRSQGMPG